MDGSNEENIPRLGMLFTDYERWLCFLEAYENLVKEVFLRSSAHPLPTDKVKREIDIKLKYYEIYYASANLEKLLLQVKHPESAK